MHRLKKQRTAYFDYAATTPVDPLVVKEMEPYWEPEGIFGNPSSVQHGYGTRAAEAVEFARKRVAALVGAGSGQIVWTSGATESNNIAILGIMRAPRKTPARLITVATEHHAVLDPAKRLRASGILVDILPVGATGLLDLDRLANALRNGGGTLVSVMWVNNETGVIQPVSEIARICRKHRALLHIDATQAIGKLPVNVRKIPVDLLSCSAHKVYGPKGIGALFVRRGVSLEPVYSGGGQERGIRPGTLPVPQIVGMGKAFELATKGLKKPQREIPAWHELVRDVANDLGDAKMNGAPKSKVPHILNISFDGIERDLASAFSKAAVSNGSACTTAKTEASHVLMSMGLSKRKALASLRISFGRVTTDKEVEMLVAELVEKVSKLRGRKA